MMPVTPRKGLKMIAAIMQPRKPQMWQVFFATEDGWSPMDPEADKDELPPLLSNASTGEVLDYEDTSMVQEVETMNSYFRRLGIVLPSQGKFYALLG